MFKSLLPKEAPFFSLLLQQNDVLCSMVATLVEILERSTANEKWHKKMTDLEAQADVIHVTIIRHLSQTFITPIDREDILRINKVQEEAVDLLHNLSNRVQILDFDRIRFPMMQLARTLQKMIVLTKSMLIGLSEKRDSHNTKEFYVLRDECEMLMSMGLGELFDTAKSNNLADFINILKWNRAYDRMEMMVNQIVDLTEVIEEAVVKNV